jgi:hypothetical protein
MLPLLRLTDKNEFLHTFPGIFKFDERQQCDIIELSDGLSPF